MERKGQKYGRENQVLARRTKKKKKFDISSPVGY